MKKSVSADYSLSEKIMTDSSQIKSRQTPQIITSKTHLICRSGRIQARSASHEPTHKLQGNKAENKLMKTNAQVFRQSVLRTRAASFDSSLKKMATPSIPKESATAKRFSYGRTLKMVLNSKGNHVTSLGKSTTLMQSKIIAANHRPSNIVSNASESHGDAYGSKLSEITKGLQKIRQSQEKKGKPTILLRHNAPYQGPETRSRTKMQNE